jgi:predicted site-specific integrase-resolvase
MEKKYYSSKEAESKLGVCRKTLQNWAKDNKINFITTKGGWRKYDIDGYLNENNLIQKIKVCYCRVSSYDQKEDLDRQIKYLEEKYPEHKIISDIGSGINFKRKGLLNLIDLAMKNLLGELVITYKDRLCRIGYELLEHIFTTYSKTQIIIENNEYKPPEQGITEDLIEIITVYSSKLYGKRSYKKE